MSNAITSEVSRILYLPIERSKACLSMQPEKNFDLRRVSKLELKFVGSLLAHYWPLDILVSKMTHTMYSLCVVAYLSFSLVQALDNEMQK